MEHTPKLTKNQITVAVEFWTNQVQHPRLRTLSSEERQHSETAPVAMAEMMATILVKEVPAEIIVKFRTLLKQALVKIPPRLGLHVDYAPDEFLANIGDAAGVPTHNWPWKTNMWFEDGKVTVSCGYGGEQKIL